MRTRVTNFLGTQLDRVQRFAGSDGWKLLGLVERTAGRNCADVPVDVFFPAADEFSGRQQRAALRKKIAEECSGCPVRDECLAGALLRGERYGSWGGVAQPDFQELARLWRRENPDEAEDPTVDRTGCDAPRHGTGSAYANYGCRCPDAREAERRRRGQQRAGAKGVA